MGMLRTYARMAILVAAVGLMAGCEPKADTTPVAESAGPGAAAKNGPATADAAKIEAVLAKADAYDGTTDKVVSSCASCKLGMMGSSEHDLLVHGYHMHFCSAECQESFAKDPDKSVLALEVPE